VGRGRDGDPAAAAAAAAVAADLLLERRPGQRKREKR
jgi:hypothetical protein